MCHPVEFWQAGLNGPHGSVEHMVTVRGRATAWHCKGIVSLYTAQKYIGWCFMADKLEIRAVLDHFFRSDKRPPFKHQI